MTRNYTHDAITTTAEDGRVLFILTRAEVLDNYRQAQMDNDSKFIKIHATQIDMMNRA